ncbi:ABC transporter permease [Labrys monachus]|uniref:ABC-type nitrate/sulfonate/bicarbonate transport system permease component n=1 Tax=Labrys monachus TaxID=217067 RepID=A0ABU0F6W5_9HYPH|nr:ABC transporter permease subunit [Labrys monachus]MDQ0390305.1 ABC-type nitrate/sulfonate/bicarbonate transport system permease component [Labrys monachus]
MAEAEPLEMTEGAENPSGGARRTAGSRPVRLLALRRLAAALDPLRLAGLVLVVAIWEGLAAAAPPIILPSPLAVAARLWNDFLDAPSLAYYGVANPNLCDNLIYTMENVALAVAVGAALGTVAGLVSARFGLVRAVVDPIMMTAGTVPILIAAPFLLIWFGVGRLSAVCLVIFYVVVILYLFAQRAASNLNPIYEDFARTLGATPRRIVVDLLIPATIPEILGGLRIALAGAWGLEAVAELLGSQEGVGKVLEVLAGATDTEGIMANLLMLGLVAVIVDAVAGWFVRRVAGWSASFVPERN